MELQREYASEVADKLSKGGLYVDVDNGENTLPKKIRNGEIAQYNFILGASHLLLPHSLLRLTAIHTSH